MVASSAINTAISVCTSSMVLIQNCSVRNELNRNPNPAPKPWALATRAVAKILW